MILIIFYIFIKSSYALIAKYKLIIIGNNKMKPKNKLKICFENKEEIDKILNNFYTKFEEDEIGNAKKEFMNLHNKFVETYENIDEYKLTFRQLFLFAHQAELELDAKGVNAKYRKDCEYHIQMQLLQKEAQSFFISTKVILIRDTCILKDGIYNWYLYEIKKQANFPYTIKLFTAKGTLKYSIDAVEQLISKQTQIYKDNIATIENNKACSIKN